MSHSFLSIPLSKVPQSVIDNMAGEQLVMSSDGSHIMLDGYNEIRELVYTEETLNYWLREEPEETRAAIVQDILNHSDEYTYSQVQAEYKNPDSVWYRGE